MTGVSIFFTINTQGVKRSVVMSLDPITDNLTAVAVAATTATQDATDELRMKVTDEILVVRK